MPRLGYDMMQQTNYISSQIFYEKFLPSIERIVKQYRIHVMSALAFYWAARIHFGCGLRISELLHIRRRDMDLSHRILALPNTKTGKEHCKCSVWEKKEKWETRKKLVSADPTCTKCHGIGSVRVVQRTTIMPYDIEPLEEFLSEYGENDILFDTNRVTMWQFYDKVIENLGLNIYSIKKITAIEGGYTHLMRESCAKMYEIAGARESIISAKLRHKPSSVTQRYTKVDLNEVLNFDDEHFRELKI